MKNNLISLLLFYQGIGLTRSKARQRMQEDCDSVDNRKGEDEKERERERESRDGSQVKHQNTGSASLQVRTNLMKF